MRDDQLRRTVLSFAATALSSTLIVGCGPSKPEEPGRDLTPPPGQMSEPVAPPAAGVSGGGSLPYPNGAAASNAITGTDASGNPAINGTPGTPGTPSGGATGSATGSPYPYGSRGGALPSQSLLPPAGMRPGGGGTSGSGPGTAGASPSTGGGSGANSSGSDLGTAK